jgi:hypothetical protein
MTTILNGRRPVSPEDGEGTFATVTEMFAMVQRANHATAFASWVVATGAMGLAVEAGTLRVAFAAPVGGVLAAALVPILAAGAYVVVLLVRAHALTAGAQEDFHRFIATASPDAREFTAPALRQLQRLTAATRHRAMLSRTALTWAYVAGTAFVVWSAAAAALVAMR